jgi:Ni/Co efflux regulator RcnB
MNSRKLICSLVAMVFAISTFAVLANAQGRGQGHGRGQNEGEQGEGHGKARSQKEHRGYYSDHERDWARDWYRDHHSHLPPGLAKKDELPPGLARQLRVRGTLPPGLMREVHPVPEEFVSHLPSPPPDCEHVLLGGNIVLLNRKTHLVLDIVALFH